MRHLVLPHTGKIEEALKSTGEWMNKITIIFLGGFVVLTLSLAHPGSVRAADPMIVGVAGPAINMVYSFVARDAGLFQKYGLDVRIVVFDAGSILAQAALSGEVKVAVSSGPATIASRTQGADTTIIGACVNILPYSLEIGRAHV